METPATMVPVAATVAAAASPPVRPDLNTVAVRQKLDVQATHAAALAKLETLNGSAIQPKHSAMFFESIVGWYIYVNYVYVMNIL